MANECYNYTLVEGPVEDLRRFIADTLGVDKNGHPTPMIAESLVPMPEALSTSTAHGATEPDPNWDVLLAEGSITQEWYDDLIEDAKRNKAEQERNIAEYGYASWYEWAHDAWGNKSGDYDHRDLPTEADAEIGSFQYSYSTAWGPLYDVFWEAVSEKYPTLKFETCYDESGMGFAGTIVAYDGVSANVCKEYTAVIPEEDETGITENWFDVGVEIMDSTVDEAWKKWESLHRGRDVLESLRTES